MPSDTTASTRGVMPGGLPALRLRPPLVLPIPPSYNHAYKIIRRRNDEGKTYYSLALTDTANVWLEEAALKAKLWARSQRWAIHKDWLIVWYQVYYPDYIRRDTHNYKLLWDGLEDIIYINDSWALPRPAIPRYDRRNPRVELHFYTPDELDEAIED